MTNTTPINEEEKTILFMATLGWTYGKYDDQCFHIFDSSGNNTMTMKSAIELTNLIQTLELKAERKIHVSYKRMAESIIDTLGQDHPIHTQSIIDYANTSIAELGERPQSRQITQLQGAENETK